jgi:hypothetical protein
MLGSITVGTGTQDIGIDQIVPAERLGFEYVLLRGNGNNNMEKPLVVAIENNTEIFVNGSMTPIVTLTNSGDYFLIPESNYTGTLHENMFVTGSKNFYMYQPLGGSSSDATGGLNFIPPVSCFLPNSVDLVPDIEKIGPDTYSGSLVVVTVGGSTVLVNGSPVGPSFGPELVAGSGGTWETYNITGLTGNAEIVSDNAMAVGFFGFNGNAGFAGYFSGFGSSPNLILSSTNVVDGKPCLPADSLYLEDGFDTYQWFKDDVEIVGEISSSYTPDEEAEYFVVLSTAACIDTSQTLFVFDCETLLPIELLHFDAEAVNNEYVELNWVTASEINNAYFEVERSRDAQNWHSILKKEGAGNSSMLINYTANDRKPLPGISYYRLKQVDFDGSYSHSDPVSVNFKGTEIISIYPNPTKDGAIIAMNSSKNGVVQLFVYAIDGRIVQSFSYEVVEGYNSVPLNLEGISPGTYTTRIISPDANYHECRVVKID